MKNRVFILFALIIVFLSSPIWGQDETAPEIFFKEKAFTADEVMEGTPIEHTYTVYNRGNALLKIFRVRPG
ncbi:MAG: hypothetical protein PVG39_11665 [Desulfobacteraceae bacterium]|jgi:hypothetical protein